MILQCSKLCYYKVSGEFLQQDPHSSYSFGKIQNVGETEGKNLVNKFITMFLFVNIRKKKKL